MSINWAGIGVGYQAAKEEQRRIAEDERRAEEASNAKKSADFQEESRGRQRSEWSEADRIKAADKADIADVNKQFAEKAPQPTTGATAQDVSAAQQQVAADQMTADVAAATAAPAVALPGTAAPAAPASMAKDPNAPAWLSAAPAVDTSNSPKLAPAVAAKVAAIAPAAGIPPAHDFNNTLAIQQELIRRKAARGDMTPEDYATKTTMLKRMQTEGISDAVNLMAQGRYDEAMQAYNAAGSMKGATIVKGEQGTTKINGQDVPTHFITIRNADGTRTTMDAAKAQYQLLDLDKQLSHADRARTFDQSDRHHADTVKLQRDTLAQHTKDAAAGRALQKQQLDQAAKHFEASTPFGQLAAIEKGLGHTLTPEQRAERLGVDKLDPKTKLLLTGLLKEQEGISSAMNKAQADGSWQPDSAGGKELRARSTVLNEKVAILLASTGKDAGKPPADVLNVNGPGAKPAAAAAAPAATRAPVLPPAGGVRPAAAAATAPAPAPAVSEDRVSKIAKAMGMFGGQTNNVFGWDKAVAVEKAAANLDAEKAKWLVAAKAGDQKGLAEGQAAVDRARDVVNMTIASAGMGKHADVLQALDM